MGTFAQPTALADELLTSEVDTFRNIDCPHYSLCVGYTAYMRWNSFSCVYCKFVDTKKFERIEDRQVSGGVVDFQYDYSVKL